MNYLVIKDLIERKTLKQFRTGDSYPCSDPARADFLIRTGYLAAPEEEEKPSVEEKPKKATKTAKATTKRSTKTKKA